MSRAGGEHPPVGIIGPVKPNGGDQELKMW